MPANVCVFVWFCTFSYTFLVSSTRRGHRRRRLCCQLAGTSFGYFSRDMCRKRHPCSCPGGCASRRVPTIDHFRHRRFGGTRRTERDVTGRLPVLTKTLQSRDCALVRRAVKARCPHSYRSGRDGVFPAGRTCPCAYCYWIPSKTATPGAHGASRGACLGRRSDSSRPAGFPRRTAPVKPV